MQARKIILTFISCGIICCTLPHANASNNQSTSSNKITITEKVPGVKNCECWYSSAQDENGNAAGQWMGDENPACKETPVAQRKYRCEVSQGLEGFQGIFQSIVRWFVYITMLLGVIAIIGAGILWSWGSDSEEYTKKAKGWVMNIAIGLLLLFTFRYILGFLAPWIFQ